MKKIIRISTMRLGFLAIAAGFMVLFTGCQQEDMQVSQDENLVVTTDETQTRAAGPSANGHGTLTFEGIPLEGEGFRHFTFHAREKNNGSVQGNGVLTYIGGVLNIRFDIDCLLVDGNTANMSGLVTHHSTSPELVGTYHYFSVEDNGEGSGSNPDQITLWRSNFGESFCNEVNPFALYPIEGGNIQVKE